MALSFTKLSALLKKQKFTIDTLYTSGGNILFVEIESPKFQHRAFVQINDTYSLKPPPNRECISLQKEEQCDATHLQYWSQMKGSIMQHGMVCVASNALTTFSCEGDTQTYRYGNEKEEESDEEEEEDEIQKLKNYIENTEKSPPEIEKSTEGTVEIIFENENGQIVENPTGTIDYETIQQEDETDKKEETDNKEKTTQLIRTADVQLGVMYLLIDLKQLYGPLNESTFEDDMATFYTELRETEDDICTQKLGEIDKLIADLHAILKQKYNKLIQAEMTARKNLDELWQLYEKCSGKEQHMKFLPQIQKLIREQKETQLKKKDEINEFLEDHKNYISDIINMAE